MMDNPDMHPMPSKRNATRASVAIEKEMKLVQPILEHFRMFSVEWKSITQVSSVGYIRLSVLTGL
jgi:hypothetical protein